MDLLDEQKNLYEWFQMSADVKLSKKLLEVFNVAGIRKISMQLKSVYLLNVINDRRSNSVLYIVCLYKTGWVNKAKAQEKASVWPIVLLFHILNNIFLSLWSFAITKEHNDEFKTEGNTNQPQVTYWLVLTQCSSRWVVD